MPLLQVGDIPKELYETISRAAQIENRSISQQTIVLLKTALNITGERAVRRKFVLQETDNFHIKNNTNEFPDPAKLTREDRNCITNLLRLPD
jgi:Fe-S cluster biosynthesis and repair protein YggX